MVDETLIDAVSLGGPLDGAEGVIESPPPRRVLVTRAGISAEYVLDSVLPGRVQYRYAESASRSAA